MNASPHTKAIGKINNLSDYRLVNMAAVSLPDNLDSPGAQFLSHVRDSLVEWAEYHRGEDIETLGERAQDDAFEQVDSTVPVYTHPLWETFVDLSAYADESSDEFDGGTMTEQASYVLARIAERLFMELAEEYVEAYVAEQDAALGFCDSDENGECSGVCVSRPHVWSPSGARCTRTHCAIVGTGDLCNDGNCEGDI